jgi:hypothetical protein
VATTLTDSGELTFLSFPIEKTEETADGDVIVWGKATDSTVDSDGQIVDAAWSAKAIAEWLPIGNVRVQHQAQRDPAGKAIDASYGSDAHYVKSLIVEPVAKELVKKGVLTAYSVGIARPVIEPDISGKARGGIIKGGKLVELSLVDRPANKNCGIQLVKSEGDAGPEWTGKVWGDEELLTKAAVTEPAEDSETEDEPTPPSASAETQPTVGKSVTIELPEDVSVAFTPRDLEKMLTRRGAAPVPDTEKRDFDPNVGTHGTDRDAMSGSDFAGRDRSFPIHDQSDVSDALQSIGRAGSDNYDAATLRANIKRIARRKGFSVPGDSDSDKPKKKASKSEDAPVLTEELLEAIMKTVSCDMCKGTGKVDGKSCPSCMTKGMNRMDADDHDDDSDADEDDKGADKAAKKPKGKKLPPWLNKPDGKGDNDADSDSRSDKGGTPADGVTGMHAEPAPVHREPDGSDIESFEKDASLSDGDNEKPSRLESQIEGKLERDAVLHFKSLGVDHQLGVLHDLCCPAYAPEDVAKAHPGSDFANIDLEWFARKAMDLAAGGTLAEASRATLAWTQARTLKTLTAGQMAELQAEAHKAFRDANPGPGSAPVPGCVSPEKFHRPYLTAGHAAESASGHADGPSATIPSGQIHAEQFGRGFISDGHAADSPANKGSVPQSVDYVPVVRENAQAAMRAMHDHVAQTFPDVCPMEMSRDEHTVMSNPVPVPGGTPATSAARIGQVHKTEDADEQIEKLLAEAELEKAQKKMRKKLGKKVLAGKMTVDEARSRLGRTVTQKAEEPEPDVQKAAETAPVSRWSDGSPVPPVWVTNGGVSPDLMKSALDTALEPLLARLGEQDVLLRKQAQMLDALADQPDPAVAPFKGLAANPQKMASARPAGAQSVAEVAERTQAMMLRELETQYRTAAHPAEREAAFRSMMKLRGLNTQ